MDYSIKRLLFLIILPLFFIVPFKVNALANPVTGGMSYFVYNIDENSPTKNGTQAFATTGSTTVYPFTSYTNTNFGWGYKTIQFTTTSPSGSKSALGYTITTTFQVLFDGLQNNMGNTSYTGWVKFNDGMVVNEVSSVELIALTSGSATFKITTTAQLTNTTSLNNMTVSLSAAKTLGFSGYGETFTVQLVLRDVVIQYAENENSAILNSLNQEQKKTNQKIDEVKEEIKKQTEESKKQSDEQKKTNETLTDDTIHGFDGKDFDEINKDSSGPISGLITMPITLLNKFLNGFNGQCQSYSLPPLLGTAITFPCLKSVLGSDIWSKIDGLMCIFMIYQIAMMVISWFEKVTSLQDTFAPQYVPSHSAASEDYIPKHVERW